jgi:methionyl aminopeptidase
VCGFYFAMSRICLGKDCDKPASLQCPTCIQLKLSPAFFCSQSCFKSNWKSHNDSVHRPKKEQDEFKAPEFRYTGKLRPHYVTPTRSVPDHIPKPDYFISGVPKSEMAQFRF